MQQVPISSDPTGASVRVDGGHAGRAPITVELDRHVDHIVYVELDGYRRQRVDLRSVSRTSTSAGPNGTMTTSTAYWLEPKSIHVRLEAKEERERPPAVSQQASTPNRVKHAALDPGAQVDRWSESSLLLEEEERMLRLVVTTLSAGAAAVGSDTYYVMLEGRQQGPLSLRALVGLLVEGRITPLTGVHSEATASPTTVYALLHQLSRP